MTDHLREPVEEAQRCVHAMKPLAQWGADFPCDLPESNGIHLPCPMGHPVDGCPPGYADYHEFTPPVEVEDEAALIVNAAAAYREAFDRHLATPSVATRLARDDAKSSLLRVARGDQ